MCEYNFSKEHIKNGKLLNSDQNRNKLVPNYKQNWEQCWTEIGTGYEQIWNK